MDYAQTAIEIVRSVRRGERSAQATVQASLDAIRQMDGGLNAFTEVTAGRALARAERLDGERKAGKSVGPLAGVPFAVKNLFDVAGIPTLAGSAINRDRPPASRDAELIRRLEAAGAILVGALNMGEFAYDFTGQSAHYGPSRNPHAPNRMSGGSSGGSGAAVASGMVPVSLGSDTNGSIRVPSSLCGVIGLKPTYGALSRTGTFPFVASLDHLGPIARTAADLAVFYDAMLGPDPNDPACSRRPAAPIKGDLEQDTVTLRFALASGYFATDDLPDADSAVKRVAGSLGCEQIVELEAASTARKAAYLVTMAEGASLHLDRLKSRHVDFDPEVRDRLFAGAMIPANWVVKAQKIRRAFRDEMLALFDQVDVVIAPATPCVAPKIGQTHMVVNGVEMSVRPNLGIFTQPISFIGFPVVTVPVWSPDGGLPIGVQLIGKPWSEGKLLRVANWLERRGIVHSPAASHQMA